MCWISTPYIDGVFNEGVFCDKSGTPRELLGYAQAIGVSTFTNPTPPPFMKRFKNCSTTSPPLQV